MSRRFCPEPPDCAASLSQKGFGHQGTQIYILLGIHRSDNSNPYTDTNTCRPPVSGLVFHREAN